MKKILSFMAIALSFSAQSVSASTIGFTDTLSADGTTVSVVIQGSGFSTGLGGAALDLTWDSAILSLSATNVSESAIYDHTLTNVGSIGPGFETGLATATFGTAASTINQPFDIFNLVFDVVSQGTSAFNIAINSNGLNDAGTLNLIDLNANPVTLNSGTISAVPLPPALLLFGSSLLGLLGVNGRRKV